MTTETDTLLPVNKDLFVEFERAYKRAYRLRNKEKIKQYERRYAAANPEVGRRRSAKWRKAHPDQAKEYNITWEKENPDKRKAIKAKRKEMGFQPLNEWFEGSNGHHVNNDQVIYIPVEMHRRYHNLRTGEGMAEMNALAFQYLFEHT